MTPIHCPVCHDDMQAPAAQIGAIGVCPNCGASLVIGPDGDTRRATAADTTALSAEDLQTLRKARKRTR